MKAVLDHVGIAVNDLEPSLAFFRDALGLEVEAPEEVPEQRVRAQFIATGASSLELLQATNPDSPISKFLERRGPGLHHITLRVDDIRAALAGELPRVEVLLAAWDGRPAAFALFFHNFSTFVGRRGLYLEDLYVRPEFRGKGIGKRLLLELVRIARDRRCGRMEWVALEWNQPAIEFYRALTD